MTEQFAINLLELQFISISNPFKKRWLRLHIKEFKRKLTILLKFAPGTIIAIILENLFGILKESDVISVIDYMMTNQANIYMFSLLAVYLFWIYNTNENVKQFENKIRDINIELLRRN